MRCDQPKWPPIRCNQRQRTGRATASCAELRRKEKGRLSSERSWHDGTTPRYGRAAPCGDPANERRPRNEHRNEEERVRRAYQRECCGRISGITKERDEIATDRKCRERCNEREEE
jgi:hypothetical protein